MECNESEYTETMYKAIIAETEKNMFYRYQKVDYLGARGVGASGKHVQKNNAHFEFFFHVLHIVTR